ncbi:MAG: tetratricopeptide repeat protein, partial [Gallionellaceae bacterium]|nr:tetratricopeptide repeat protein [Gallionellaceae bacterium]
GHATGMMNDHASAEACFRKAAAIQPKSPDAWHNLGLSYAMRGMFEQAISAYSSAIGAAGNPHPDMLVNLGLCYLQLDRYEEAARVFFDAARAKNTSDVWTFLGMSWQGQDQYKEALSAYLKAIERGGSDYSLNLNIGTCYEVLGDYANAAKYAESALRHKPGDGVAFYNLGAACFSLGELDRALQAFERSALPAAKSARLLALNYVDPIDPIALKREHEAVAHSFDTTPFQARSAPDLNDSTPLRIGFVSADFREHPVAFFLEGMLKCIDRSRLSLFFYSDVRKEDAVTARFCSIGGEWRNLFGCSDEKLAEAVAADHIHILIDLAGYTNGSRITAFARRMAPVQATYLGYSATTGLQAMDYLLTDEALDPPGLTEAHYTEKLVRLGSVIATYTPPTLEVGILPLPMLRNGYPIWGSFAQLRKISPSTVKLWCDALKAVPHARLMVMSKGLDAAATASSLRAQFTAHDIDPARLILRGAGSLQEYLEVHNEIDLILDTAPWSGHTTTLHALWMGVPTLTLSGKHHAGRFSEMVLRAVGLDEFIASSGEAYCNKLVDLINGPQRLVAFRESGRDILLGSALCDHAALARHFEAACLGMWQESTKAIS